MNYKESVAYIESLVPTLERPTLARMKLFMADENDVQNEYKCFHVGGTNGKGSTSTILETILISCGLNVGKFTGPHIMRFNERFALNGKTMDDQEFAEIATFVKERSDAFASRHKDLGRLTWFEFLTAMAFFFFKKHEVDCAVLEVGLGGRFDATNIIENVAATIITNIDLDHMHILGDTVEKIAFEKAGIMRKGIPVVTRAEGLGLVELEAQARDRGAVLIRLPEDKTSVVSQTTAEKIDHALDSLSLYGPHQRGNAELAVVALLASNFLSPPDRFLGDLGNALKNVYFPGRMQRADNKILIMDGAHNPAGAKALRRALDERLMERKQSTGVEAGRMPALPGSVPVSASLLLAASDTPLPASILPSNPAISPASKPGSAGTLPASMPGTARVPPASCSGYCFILGFFGNKNVPEFLRELLRKGDRVIAVEADVRRSTYPKEEIAALCADLGIESVIAQSMSDALKLAHVADSLPPPVTTRSAAVKTRTAHVSQAAAKPGTAGVPPAAAKTPPTCTTDNRVDTDCEVVVTGSFAVLKELMLTLGWQTVEDGRDVAIRY